MATARWHIRLDRADATEVTVTFAGDAYRTTVTVVHRGWERLGAKGEEWSERNMRGWGGLLPHYLAAGSVTLP